MTTMTTDGLHRDSKRCCKVRINNLWSVWYCVVVVGLEVYLLTTNIQNFIRYIDLPWPEGADPRNELNVYVGLIGATILLVPFFVVSSVIRVGNLPNDGFKLGIGPGGDPELLLPDYYISKSLKSRLRRLWRHCGPTAPLLHILTALFLLLPKMLIQAKLIKHGFLSKGDIWKTDLDFMIIHDDRLVVLHFLTSLNASSVLAKESGLNTDIFYDKINVPEIQLQELGPVSPEFINFALALLVYAVRYPSVFWHTSRSFGLLFSAQMVFNAAQILLAFAGFTVLYNIHIIGPTKGLVIYDPVFLLDETTSVIIFIAYCLLLVSFGCVMYLYGYLKYREQAAKQSMKHHVTLLSPDYNVRCCGYAPHVMAFVVLCLASMCAAPLMYDFIVVYRGSLDGAVLAGVIGTIFHLLFWVILWLVLTLKHKWQFSLLISGSHSKLKNPEALIQIAHDIEMTAMKSSKDNVPLIVIGDGQTFTVVEDSCKKSILSVAQKSSEVSKHHEEDIYWLKPHPVPPKQTSNGESQKKKKWLGRSSSTRSKVSFDDMSMLDDENPYGKTSRSASKSPKSSARIKKKIINRLDSDSDDGGDYATLRGDLPRVQEVDEDDERQITEYTPLSPDDNEDGDYVDYGYLSASYPIPSQVNVPVTVHNNSYDSGMPVRYDSVSDASSVTPPDKAHGSESSSSGNYSMSDKRASSLEDLQATSPCPPIAPSKNLWKSMSLQRTVPTSLPLHDQSGRRNIMLLNTHYNHKDSELCCDTSTVVIKSKNRNFARQTNFPMTSFCEEYSRINRKQQQQNMNKRKYPGSVRISQELNDLNISPSKYSNVSISNTSLQRNGSRRSTAPSSVENNVIRK